MKRLLLATSAATLAWSTALAQTPEPLGEPEDEIVVTGSRIALDPNLVSSTPVQSLGSDDILLSGEINLSEVINDIPALVSSTSTENSASGGASLNLRGLGAARTLTLVNGRRHVAGFRGSSAVDVGSIPRALVERVEVTTGGASAIYGADAVTGVVNFVLKDDFEGLEANLRGGISTEGDAENGLFEITAGKNFDNGRGNITLSASVVEDTGLVNADRAFSRDNNIAFSVANPDLRLQARDIGPDTPNFQGLRIGTSLSDISTDGLTPAELAIIGRTEGAPRLIVARDPRVWLSSQEGSIAPGFGGRGTTYVDINNNGIADCQESRGGQIGFLSGCWVTNPDGSISVFQESLISDTSFRGVALPGGVGSGGYFSFNGDSLYPETDSYAFNLTGNYELADNLKVYAEGKYVLGESVTSGEQDTFYDTLFIQPDNPYIPEQLQPVVDEVGYLLLTQDPVGFLTGDYENTYTERETIRGVLGATYETESGHVFDVSVNHGRFTNTQDSTTLFLDRQFAATDAVRNEAGEIVCRSDLDPNAAYPIDYFTAGNGFADGGYSTDQYYSFTPGDGQCQPLNPFGRFAVSQAAQDFIAAPISDEIELEQTVISAVASGSFDVAPGLFADAIGYAVGAEYRKETSRSTLDPNRLGVLPAGSPFGGGNLVSNVTGENGEPGFLNTLISIDNDQQFNTFGEYDVTEGFAEIRVPLLLDARYAKELTVDAAIRYADYSTLGGQTTWKVGGTWAPDDNVSIRGTYSSAVRAPNISELFDPELPIFIGSNQDPCDPDNIDLGSENRQANCVAALTGLGVPRDEVIGADGSYIWQNPLTGRFSGTSGGNPDLEAETADTFTIGAVFTPTFLTGFTLTADYWDIQIDDAIAAVAAGDILRGCYDSADFPNVPFCGQFERRGDGGLTDLTSGSINFARLEASGVDVAASYGFDVGANAFDINVVGSFQEKLDRFFNPLDLDEVDPELREVQIPEVSGNVSLGWSRGPIRLGGQMSYQSNQFMGEITAAQAAAELGTDLVSLTHFETYRGTDETGESYIFDLNARYEYNDQLSVYGGVNNVTDEIPFINQTAWPVSPRGRFVFLGVNFKM